MASKIRVLSEHTINKIAAGEVIENPASVVKELVENSIDAEANDICIEIKGGGRQLIRITDNGSGMNTDDALLCLERHATSKIREVEEIQDLSTMGFRGEAIPSIASISKFTLLTCHEENSNALSGTMVIVDGGKIVNCSPAARSKGTTIEVKSLFFNVPVRRKFMKSPAFDSNEILKTVSLISLGYPNIKFQLINDGKTVLTTAIPPESSFLELLKTRIATVLGQDFQQNMIELANQKEFINLQGFIGLPHYTRHNRSGQYLYINQRAVTSPIISYAVKDGYGTALATGRSPVFVLHLNIPGEMVDVNVHPQKKEVRLRQEQLIRDLVVQSVTTALKQSHTTSYATHSIASPEVSPVFAKAWKNSEENALENSETWTFRPKTLPQSLSSLSLITSNEKTTFTNLPIHSTIKGSEPQVTTHQTNLFPTPMVKPNLVPRAIATLSRYILIDGTNLEGLAKSGESQIGGLVLVDQKAAHARVLFEKLLKQKSGEPLPQQMLLIPYSIDVSPFEAEALRAALPALNRMGIHIQEFGARSFLVDAIPQLFGNSNLEMLISEIIRDVRQSHTNNIADQVLGHEQTKKIALAACRASVSGDRRLSLEEAQALLDQLVSCQNPYQCPSGKSTLIHLSSDELAKLFQKG